MSAPTPTRVRKAQHSARRFHDLVVTLGNGTARRLYQEMVAERYAKARRMYAELYRY